MATITIINGDTTTGELELSDFGHTQEDKGTQIKWKIADPNNSNVASIEKIVMTSGSEIFSELPNNSNGKWRATIHQNADDDAQCKYSIFWKAKGDTRTFEHDPKISVKPPTR